ncbi:MAG: uroporphyrinogen-III C-methyltransferase [Candidatus Pelagadaptatus aseana]|uniref:uroporphyrinogen-III C-methyltransferase n=1 Tax=Candidatus Pelagadaptatus aseana TaxID=3120508 RepID=UPI0039B36294
MSTESSNPPSSNPPSSKVEETKPEEIKTEETGANATEASVAEDKPVAADQPTEDKPAAAESASQPAKLAPPVATAPRKSSPLLLILMLLVLITVAGMGYWGWMQQRTLVATQTSLQKNLEGQQARMIEMQQLLEEARDQSSWRAAIAGIDKRLEHNSKRLRSLESTNRDDWLLAEAEYLLRLANQRMLMERGTEGALALLQAADQILKDLDNDELFPVRQQLARDMAALKLAPGVDRSGLYLQLAALSEQIEALSDLPGDLSVKEQPVPVAEAMVAESEQQLDQGVWTRIKTNFWEAMAVVGKYIRVRHHDQTIVPVLPPESSAYLRQNIRLTLEQAQLAMLRENTQVYQHSLAETEALLRKYFATQDKGLLLADEVHSLAQMDVKVQLPSISASLTALREFISRQHKLDSLGTDALTAEEV